MDLIPDSQATQGTSRFEQEDTSMLEDNLDNSITYYPHPCLYTDPKERRGRLP